MYRACLSVAFLLTREGNSGKHSIVGGLGKLRMQSEEEAISTAPGIRQETDRDTPSKSTTKKHVIPVPTEKHTVLCSAIF